MGECFEILVIVDKSECAGEQEKHIVDYLNLDIGVRTKIGIEGIGYKNVLFDVYNKNDDNYNFLEYCISIADLLEIYKYNFDLIFNSLHKFLDKVFKNNSVKFALCCYEIGSYVLYTKNDIHDRKRISGSVIKQFPIVFIRNDLLKKQFKEFNSRNILKNSAFIYTPEAQDIFGSQSD